MFGKLKDKLKKTLSIFSKKTEEEADVDEALKEELIEEEIKESKPVEIPEKKKEVIEEEKTEEQPVQKEVEEISKKEIVEEPEETSKEESQEEIETPSEEVSEETPSEKEKKEESELQPKKVQDQIKENIPSAEDLIEKTKEKFAEKDIQKEEVKDERIEEKPIEREKKEIKEEQPKEKKSFFGKLKETITTKTISENKFDELFWDLELVLLENNVSVEVIDKIKQDLKTELVDKPLPRDVPKKIEETLKNTLTEIVSFEPINLIEKIKQKQEKPYVIAFFGINGSGKTTSIAKLSHLLQKNNLKTVLAAGDTFRAAAIQQLEEHANKLNTKIIKHEYGSDAAAVAFDAIKFAQKNEIDVVLIDTAGRLHSNTNLMDELKKIVKVANPDLKIFVGESITGNDCIEQAQKFNEVIDIDAAILTKADVDEKGGAQLSIAYTIKKPIIYLGVGQEYQDLEEFDVKTVLKRLGF